MKKFLFTLVALLAVGSLQAAECRFYVDNFYGQTGAIEVPVKLHLTEYAISAWQVDITLPDGITFDGAEMDPGADMSIPYVDSRGRDKTFDSPLMQSIDGNKGSFIAANTISGYYQVDGAWVAYGALKWLPGEYDEMIILYLNVDENYDGTGSITFTTTVSSGADERPDVTPWVKGSENPYAEESILIGPETPTMLDCAAPVINQALGENEVTVTITWNESDGNQVYTGEYTYTRPEYGQPDETYNVEAYTEASNTYNESPHATATINVPAKDPVWQDVAAPVISQEVQADKVVVTITWPTTTGNQVYTGQYEYTRPEAGEADQSYDVEAYTEADYPYSESAHATATINVPAKEPVVVPDLQGQIVFSAVNQEDGSFTVSYEGPEEGVVVTVADDAIVPARADGTYNLPDYGTYNVTAVAKKDGYNDLEKTEQLTWNAPLEKTQDPTVHVTSGNQTKTITCEPNANDPESVIYISIDGGATFEVYTDPVVLGIGEYDIVVYAVAPNKAKSNDVELKVVVDENTQPDPTAVNELNGEKAVAGVRYFNMAGQEMQEANGVTIVVTTYTDGTTSAVKVIK